MLAPSDPTDHALATIASILDYPEPRRQAEKSPTEKTPIEKPVIEKAPAQQSSTLLPGEADGYTKIGPGPIAAIRFKWTVRRSDNDEYFVDERIGDNAAQTTSGPMAKEAAVKLVDDREAEARQRFEQLRSEMIGHATVADLARSGEA
jgi:hypothetical protein